MNKRQDVVDFIARYTREHAYPPSVRDIRDGCGMASTSSVLYHLQKLEEGGVIERSPDGKSRGMRLTGARFVLPGDTVEVLVGDQIRSGKFVTSVDGRRDTLVDITGATLPD